MNSESLLPLKHFASSTASGAFSASFAGPKQVKLCQIKFTLASAGQGSDTANIYIQSASAIPNCSLISKQMSGLTAILQVYDPPITIFKNDSIVTTYPNSGNTTVGVELGYIEAE